jgi:hypothetical protein
MADRAEAIDYLRSLLSDQAHSVHYLPGGNESEKHHFITCCLEYLSQLFDIHEAEQEKENVTD